MLRKIRNKKAQAMSTEYVIFITMFLAMLTAISFYFKRAVQARFKDARRTMFAIIVDRSDPHIVQELYRAEYEPYYSNVITRSAARATHDTRLLPGGTTGIFRKIVDESKTSVTQSETGAPGTARWE
ncbi:MAG: hypothetical protein K8S27_06105 [Candidatus Omnitrophica bacterium]|nr:hypothetical protein [Candidatus Omnitrophota bacterium]